MVHENAHRQFKIQTLGLTIVYAVIVVLHLFFIPDFLAGVKNNGSVNIQSNTKGIYYLLRNDRTTFTENKSNHNTPKSLVLFVFSLAAGLFALYQWPSKNRQPERVLAGKRYSYLTCRIMRI